MTDQPPTYTDPSGAMLTIDSARGWGEPEHVYLSIVAPAAFDRLGLLVPTARLLAMIDAEDPDALRAYLRERSDLIDAPGADSTEDVDENPEPVITVTPEALDAAEQLGRYVAEMGDAFARGLAR